MTAAGGQSVFSAEEKNMPTPSCSGWQGRLAWLEVVSLGLKET